MTASVLPMCSVVSVSNASPRTTLYGALSPPTAAQPSSVAAPDETRSEVDKSTLLSLQPKA